MRAFQILLIFYVALAATAFAGGSDPEIQYLLDTVGASDCVFTRNGKDHSAAEARDHLAMKYRRAGSRVRTAEAFIERLASKSSWTGQPYLINCDGESLPSRDWLTIRLGRYRAGDAARED